MPDVRKGSTRRAVVAAASALAVTSARAEPFPPTGSTAMSVTTRRATPQDLPTMASLLLREVERRNVVDPSIWPIAVDAFSRIQRAVAASFEPAQGAPPEFWMVAEADGRIVGLAHAVVVPPPPIYAAPGRPGLILDDSFTLEGAPPGSAEVLLSATEVALGEAGATGLIASCLEAGPWRPMLAAAGYEPVTLYMSKHGFASAPSYSARPADIQDIPAIVALSADHRATLQELNQRFWTIHPEADERFDRWMRYSLTLTDRNMIVVGPADAVEGYLIAQPMPALHLPAGHDLSPVGILDDFYATDFAEVDGLTEGVQNAADLLAAAEVAFMKRDVQAALVVCPAAWRSKRTVLERQGYQTAKMWMLKA